MDISIYIIYIKNKIKYNVKPLTNKIILYLVNR